MIKIVKDGIEIDFVRETLNVSSENNAMSLDFKSNHTSYPFLVVENSKTKKALGSGDITSINKQRSTPVDVFFSNKKYKGQLQILSYSQGFRKCNLKFWSELINITPKKIRDYMPTFSVIPEEEQPIPFSEESEYYVNGYEHWKTYPIPFINSGYPAVKWNFPVIQNIANLAQNGFNFSVTEYTLNNAIINSSGVVVVNNRNAPAPFVYLLTPIEFILDSIGFKMEGSFVEHPVINRILMLSHNHQGCLTKGKAPITDLTWDGKPWQSESTLISYKETTYTTEYEGDHYIEVRCWDVPPYTMMGGGVLSPMRVYLDNVELNVTAYESHIEDYLLIMKIKVEVSDDMIGQLIKVKWRSASAIERVPQHTINLYLSQEDDIYLPHPTVQLSRYVPDWTFGEFLNQLKRLFNLKITPDDDRKRLKIDFVEKPSSEIITEILKKSLLISENDMYATDGFRIGFDNEIDDSLLISREGLFENGVSDSEFITEIKSKFKFIPNILGISSVSEETKEKEGVGLILYDSSTKPNTLGSYDGITLKIVGPGGIHDSFHKVFLKSRLNASKVVVEGVFTEIELNKIMEADELYFNNQRWRFISFRASETHHKKINATLTIESVTY